MASTGAPAAESPLAAQWAPLPAAPDSAASSKRRLFSPRLPITSPRRPRRRDGVEHAGPVAHQGPCRGEGDRSGDQRQQDTLSCTRTCRCSCYSAAHLLETTLLLAKSHFHNSYTHTVPAYIAVRLVRITSSSFHLRHTGTQTLPIPKLS